MANKLFLHNTDYDVAAGTKNASPTQGSVKVASDASATVTGPTAGVSILKGGVAIDWLSPPLQAVTIAGTVTFNFWGLESALTANVGFDCRVLWADSDGVFIATIVASEHGVELGTSAAVKNWTAAPTSRALRNGDRIRIQLLGNDAGGTMASGKTFTLDYDGPTGADGDSYVQFTETIVLMQFGSALNIRQAVTRAANW